MSNHVKEQAVLLGLIAVISLVFLAQSVFGLEFYGGYMAVPADIVLAWDVLLQGDLQLKPFLTLFTCAVLHGDFGHLLFNMLFLWIFAGLAVKLVGNRWMLVTFVFTALCGSLFHVVKNADSFVPMLGASGAVMGFEGLYLGMVVRWRLPDPSIWPMAHPISPMQLAAVGIMGLYMDYMGFLGGNLGVAYSAHLGGFVGGVLLGALIVPMPKVAQLR